MTQKYKLENSKKTTLIIVEDGELISIKIKQDNIIEEIIHQKNDNGWSHSDIEMFPIIGPTNKNNFRVKTKIGEAVLDQHGILRELNYQLIKENENELIFEKQYITNTKIKNSKYPNKSIEEFISWPYGFIFQKKFELLDNELKISFNIKSEENIPFMLGYHPAFKLSGNLDEIIKATNLKTTQFTIKEIMDVGDLATPILNCNKINLIKKNGLNIKIETLNFNNFMLWSPSNNMVCIEPITFYPYGDKKLEEGFDILKEQKNFEVKISWV